MKKTSLIFISFFLCVIVAIVAQAESPHSPKDERSIQLGPRPFFLVNSLDDHQLKSELTACVNGPFQRSDFSIAHRGAPLQFPEHTRESYEAAALMGAGIGECDVTFTKDRELVCRHSQCDLHTTTNILAIPQLAAKCSTPFTPARIDKESGKLVRPAKAKCCTSDISLNEFLSLQGKMDGFNPRALTAQEYLAGTPNWRTDLYSQRGTVLSHAQSIKLFAKLGMKMTPELKTPDVTMPFEGNYSQENYAQQMIDEYKKAGIEPKSIFPQSFNRKDIEYWLISEPKFAEQSIYLDGRYRDSSFDIDKPKSWIPSMTKLYASGVRIIAPPLWMLLTTNDKGKIIPSQYATEAKQSGLKIITWTLERSGPLQDGGGWYYQTIKDVIDDDSDMLKVIDILAQDVGVIGMFSDWPATVTFYANCKGLL